MAPHASPLPTGWMKILDEVNMRLDEAIATTNARMHEAPSFETNLALAQHQEVARWHERLRRLSAYLESAEQIVHSVDEILHGEESRLRNHLVACAMIRQKLTEQTAGAIG
jgi:hypothetical protein